MKKNGESIEYYRTYGFGETISWTKLTESYRDATSEKNPWTHPTSPDNITYNKCESCILVCHKHVMKNEPDQYFFTRLDADDLDISWSTPSEEWRDAQRNEKLLITPDRPNCTSQIVPMTSHAQRIQISHNFDEAAKLCKVSDAN